MCSDFGGNFGILGAVHSGISAIASSIAASPPSSSSDSLIEASSPVFLEKF